MSLSPKRDITCVCNRKADAPHGAVDPVLNKEHTLTGDRVVSRFGDRPFCQCGCGERVRKAKAKYVGGHVPHAIRAEGGRKGGLSRVYRYNREKFEDVFQQLTREGQRITKDTLLTVLAETFRRGYALGYRASEGKWKRAGQDNTMIGTRRKSRSVERAA